MKRLFLISFLLILVFPYFPAYSANGDAVSAFRSETAHVIGGGMMRVVNTAHQEAFDTIGEFSLRELFWGSDYDEARAEVMTKLQSIGVKLARVSGNAEILANILEKGEWPDYETRYDQTSIISRLEALRLLLSSIKKEFEDMASISYYDTVLYDILFNRSTKRAMSGFYARLTPDIKYLEDMKRMVRNGEIKLPPPPGSAPSPDDSPVLADAPHLAPPVAAPTPPPKVITVTGFEDLKSFTEVKYNQNGDLEDSLILSEIFSSKDELEKALLEKFPNHQIAYSIDISFIPRDKRKIIVYDTELFGDKLIFSYYAADDPDKKFEGSIDGEYKSAADLKDDLVGYLELPDYEIVIDKSAEINKFKEVTVTSIVYDYQNERTKFQFVFNDNPEQIFQIQKHDLSLGHLENFTGYISENFPDVIVPDYAISTDQNIQRDVVIKNKSIYVVGYSNRGYGGQVILVVVDEKGFSNVEIRDIYGDPDLFLEGISDEVADKIREDLVKFYKDRRIINYDVFDAAGLGAAPLSGGTVYVTSSSYFANSLFGNNTYSKYVIVGEGGNTDWEILATKSSGEPSREDLINLIRRDIEEDIPSMDASDYQFVFRSKNFSTEIPSPPAEFINRRRIIDINLLKR